MNSDALIIGGGIIGLSIARELRKNGVRKITVLDRSAIGQEASFAAAGMLAPNAETEEIDDFYHFCVESNLLYPQFAEELREETGIDIELDRSGTFYLAFSEKDESEIELRFERQKTAGLNVERFAAHEIRRLEPFVSPDIREGLFFAEDWQVENRKLLDALRRYAKINGISLVEGCEVKRIVTENRQAIEAETVSETYSADKIVLATGAWTSLIKFGEPLSRLEVRPIRGQMISFRSARRLFQKVIYSPRGYIVPRADGRILAGATVEDVGFDKSTTSDGLSTLRDSALEIVPSLGNLEISDSWAGLRPYAVDGLPIIGEFEKISRLFVATAHYRNGILLTPITAKIIVDLILGVDRSRYLDIFGPGRF